jgi:hypothetical protein
MGMFIYLWNEGEYIIHFKYSSMLNSVYVSMMYGIALPILFPITALTLFNLWFCERIVVSYYAKLPPALDDTLTTNALGVLRWAPLLLLMNSYWMLSNKQMFSNSWSYISIQSDSMLSNHFFELELNQASPLLIVAF